MGPREVPEDARFEELGIDSILRMPIVSKIQEATDIPLPPSIFDDYPTLSALRRYVLNAVGLDTSDNSNNDQISSAILTSGTSTPMFQHETLFAVLLEIAAKEIGISIQELKPSTVFSVAGVNPTNATKILSTFKTQAGIELSTSFFTDHTAVSSAQKALQTPKQLLTPELQASSKTTDSKGQFYSRSIMLSGSHLPDSPILLLMPDGAGSPSSYTDLPPLPGGTAIYGLESPFCHEPYRWDCSFEMVATMYVKAMRKIQSWGPYMLGGWSLGGVHAYEVARQLLLDGETVWGLILIDTPTPDFLGHISDPTIELLQDTGLFAVAELVVTGSKALERVKSHMSKCVGSLKYYISVPMDPHCRPEHVFAIWGTWGIFEQFDDKVEETSDIGGQITQSKNDLVTHDEVRRLQRWMKEHGTSFGPNGWDRLVGEVECHVAEGDYRSVLHPPWVKKTGMLVTEAVNLFMIPGTN